MERESNAPRNAEGSTGDPIRQKLEDPEDVKDPQLSSGEGSVADYEDLLDEDGFGPDDVEINESGTTEDGHDNDMS
jgi:hypothetical protein